MNQINRMLENPLFFLGARTSLRRERLLPLLLLSLVVGTSCLVLLPPGTVDSTHMVVGSVVIQGILLFLFGTSEIAKLSHQITASGMIDFHRISPYPKSLSIWGLIFGAPSAWWITAIIISLFAVPHVLYAGLSLSGFFMLQAFLGLNAVLIHMAALANSFRDGRGQSNRMAMLFIGGLFLVPFSLSSVHNPANGGMPLTAAHFSFMPVLNMYIGKSSGFAHFFGIQLPSFILCLVLQGTVIFFLYTIAKRRFTSETLPALSKPLAMGILWFVLMVILDQVVARVSTTYSAMGSRAPTNGAMTIAGVGALVAGFLAASTAPTSLTHYRALIRKKKSGGSLSPWADYSLNTLVTWLCAAAVGFSVFALAATVSGQFGGMIPVIGAAAILVLQMGYARQLIRLKWPSHDFYYSLFFGLVFWGLPAVISGLLRYSGSREAAEYVLRLCAPALLIAVKGDSGAVLSLGFVANALLIAYMAISVTGLSKRLKNQVMDNSTNSGK